MEYDNIHTMMCYVAISNNRLDLSFGGRDEERDSLPHMRSEWEKQGAKKFKMIPVLQNNYQIKSFVKLYRYVCFCIITWAWRKTWKDMNWVVNIDYLEGRWRRVDLW